MRVTLTPLSPDHVATQLERISKDYTEAAALNTANFSLFGRLGLLRIIADYAAIVLELPYLATDESDTHFGNVRKQIQKTLPIMMAGIDTQFGDAVGRNPDNYNYARTYGTPSLKLALEAVNICLDVTKASRLFNCSDDAEDYQLRLRNMDKFVTTQYERIRISTGVKYQPLLTSHRSLLQILATPPARPGSGNEAKLALGQLNQI
jgi:hypothetical protein